MTRTSSTFVLVPGAWQGNWAWQPVARRLRAAGHQALTLTLPGLAADDSPAGLHLSDAAAYVVGIIEKRDLEQVTLVAHGWGGYPVTEAAHRLMGRVAKVVYYNAIVPERGVPLVGESENYAVTLRKAFAASPNGTVAVTPEQASQLLQDQSADAQRLFFELLVPQPGAYFFEAIDVPPVTTLGIPVAYVSSADDRALARPAAEFAARLGLTPVTVPGSHQSMLTQPDEVAQALLAA
jgi:pimeloyl-ACP methyl ester carboxylesterase